MTTYTSKYTEKKATSLFIAPLSNGSFLKGTVHVPSSKSHSIRALFLAAMAKGTSTIYNILLSDDTQSCLNVLQAWGVKYALKQTQIQTNITIQSPGLEHLLFYKQFTKNIKPIQINIGNSGTTLYLATALATLGTCPVYFTGDNSIQKRSAKNLLLALEQLGAHIEYHNRTNPYCAPFTVQGKIHAGTVSIQCPTSQYLSALLLALSFIKERSSIEAQLDGEFPYIDMTMNWLKKRSKANIHNKNYSLFSIQGVSSIQPFTCSISGDYSSASFFICAAALFSKKLHITGLDKHDEQGDASILNILRNMGKHFYWQKNEDASYSLTKKKDTHKDTELSNPSSKYICNLQHMPDTLPILASTAPFLEKPTHIINVEHARIKETDRIAMMTQELKKIGVRVDEHKDGMTIYPSKVIGGVVDSHQDHRIAMAFSIAALGSQKGILIQQAETASITYPSFYTTLQEIGADISQSTPSTHLQ